MLNYYKKSGLYISAMKESRALYPTSEYNLKYRFHPREKAEFHGPCIEKAEL